MDKIIRLGDQWYKTVAPDMTNSRLQIEKYRKVASQWYQEDHSFSSYVDLVLNKYSKGKALFILPINGIFKYRATCIADFIYYDSGIFIASFQSNLH